MKNLQKLKEHIKQYVSLGDLLREDGRITYDIDEEQIHCPFHGVDRKKSARYYKVTDTMYCWVCKKVWDVFSYISQQNGLNLKSSINYLVQTYHINISSVPEEMEVLIQGITEPQKIILDNNKVFLLQLHDYILGLREKIDVEKYKKLVFSYMLLKYAIPKEKFSDACGKINKALNKIKDKMQYGKQQ